MARAYGDGLTSEELAIASNGVADAARLWREFIDEMARFGEVRVVSDDEIHFRERYQPIPRTFMVSARQLRHVLVVERAEVVRRESRAYRTDHLPQWLIDDLWEVIGSDEAPYDDPVLTLDIKGKLVPPPPVADDA